MRSTSITNLKANLSAILKQVRGGEAFLVTDRDKPVAVLKPLSVGEGDERLAGLVAAGVVSPAVGASDVEAFLSLPVGRCEAPLSGAIVEERELR
jgi:prevent-host-death family protein